MLEWTNDQGSDTMLKIHEPSQKHTKEITVARELLYFDCIDDGYIYDTVA